MSTISTRYTDYRDGFMAYKIASAMQVYGYSVADVHGEPVEDIATTFARHGLCSDTVGLLYEHLDDKPKILGRTRNRAPVSRRRLIATIHCGACEEDYTYWWAVSMYGEDTMGLVHVIVEQLAKDISPYIQPEFALVQASPRYESKPRNVCYTGPN